jgi:hypothetical protein
MKFFSSQACTMSSRRTPRRVRPRTTRSQGTPKKGGDVDMDDAEPISTDERLGEADDSR